MEADFNFSLEQGCLNPDQRGVGEEMRVFKAAFPLHSNSHTYVLIAARLHRVLAPTVTSALPELPSLTHLPAQLLLAARQPLAMPLALHSWWHLWVASDSTTGLGKVWYKSQGLQEVLGMRANPL